MTIAEDTAGSVSGVAVMSACLDNVAGHRRDVDAFLRELGAAQAKNTVIGRNEGFAKDYDHAMLLTDPGAVHDHFPLILRGLKS